MTTVRKICTKIRTRYNNWLESAIRLSMLTAVTFTVTACYGTPPEGYYNDPDWQKEQDTLVHNMERLGRRIAAQQQTTDAQPVEIQTTDSSDSEENRENSIE